MSLAKYLRINESWIAVSNLSHPELIKLVRAKASLEGVTLWN